MPALSRPIGQSPAPPNIFQKTLRWFGSVPFLIAHSPLIFRLFVLSGFLVFSLFLVYLIINVVQVNDSIRKNEEKSRATALLIKANFEAVDNILTFFEKAENKTGDIQHQLDLFNQLNRLNLSGYAEIKDGKVGKIFGQLDPTCQDSVWEKKRWVEIGFNIQRLSQPQPRTFFVSYERRFRTKAEVAGGKAFAGTLVMTRTSLVNNQATGRILLMPMENLSKYMSLTMENYDSGDYDYLVDQNGNLMCHPRLFIMCGTDGNGNQMKSASKAAEVGTLPVNTRDADWIAGSEILNQAFERMVRGEFSSVIYKNLQDQARLTSFNKIALDSIRIGGTTFGIVTGKGMGRAESLIAPILLESPNSLKQVMYILLGLYMALVFGWLLLFNHIRKIYRDLIDLSLYMSRETAIQLKLVPIPRHKTRTLTYPNTTVALITFLSTEYWKEIPKVNEQTNRAIVFFQQYGFVTEKFEMKSFAALYTRGQGEAILPDELLDLMQSPDFKSITKQTGNGRPIIQICFTIANVQLEIGRKNETSKASVAIQGGFLEKLLSIQQHAVNLDYQPNQIKLIYNKESIQHMPNNPIGKKHTINDHEFYEINSQIAYNDL